MASPRPILRQRRPCPPDRRYRPFAEAREFVHALWLLSRYDWDAYLRGELARLKGELPIDIPASPHWVYRGQGWCGLADWLGNGRKEPPEPRFLPFAKARSFSWGLSLGSTSDWRAYCRGETEACRPLPGNVPSDPARVYAYTWRGWSDWLGCHDGAPPGGRYRKFSDARDFVRGLGLKNVREWTRFIRGAMPDVGELPEDIPVNPRSVYHAYGFRGFGDWLGTDFVAARHWPALPFEEAREFARNLGLRNQEEWFRWTKGDIPGHPDRPWNLPADPAHAYAGKGFTTWGDFLGTGNIGSKLHVWRDYAAAREFARGLSLSGVDEWNDYVKGGRPDLPPLPADIPHTPFQVYGKQYTCIGDFLGTGKLKRGHHPPFPEARDFARSLGLPSRKAWVSYAKGDLRGLPPLPAGVPACPEVVYRDSGWAGFPDWLGNKKRPFAEARAFASTLGIRTGPEWREWARDGAPGKPRHPRDIPVTPDVTYFREGWTSWADFLATGRPSVAERTFVPYLQAVAFARGLGIRSSTEWRAWCRGDLEEKEPRPFDIPADPSLAYRNRGWHGWPAFLGTGRRRSGG